MAAICSFAFPQGTSTFTCGPSNKTCTRSTNLTHRRIIRSFASLDVLAHTPALSQDPGLHREGLIHCARSSSGRRRCRCVHCARNVPCAVGHMASHGPTQPSPLFACAHGTFTGIFSVCILHPDVGFPPLKMLHTTGMSKVLVYNTVVCNGQ